MNFEAVDEYMLRLFTKFSHWFQRLTGKTNFFLAHVACVIGLMSAVALIISAWRFGEPAKLFLVFLGSLSVIPYFGLAFITLIIDERIRNRHSDVQDPLVLIIRHRRTMAHRLESIVISQCGYMMKLVFNLLGISLPVSLVVMYLCFAPVNNFICVDPLPPGKSKIRKWIESMKIARLQTAHAGT